MIYLIALLSITLGSVAQFFLKLGVSRQNTGIKIESLWVLITDPWFLSGVLAYALSFVIWLYVLSRIELSRAYPMVSIGYILTTAMACIWLGETLCWSKILGIALIISGVFFIARL
ncbi:MAG: EamA family transporter [Lachnospiraceae bacterium]|nr:EamA family transporter [Lachnospiraceae bacterium]